MVVVRLLRYWRGYNAGETASFPADLAEPLIMGGFAEPVTAPGSATADAAAAPKPARPARRARR